MILLVFGITFTAVGIILVIIAFLAAASVTNLRLAIRIHWGEAFIHGRLFALIAGIVIALIGAVCLVFHFIG